MSTIYPAGVYAYRVPQVILNAIPESVFPDYTNLRELATVLNKEDVFYFVYEQIEHLPFLRFMSDSKLYSILQLPANISWLNEVENEYRKYAERRKHASENTENTVENTPIYLDTEFHHAFINEKTNGHTFIEYREFKEPITSPTMKKDFGFNSFTALLNHIGVDATLSHPALKVFFALD